MAEYDMQKRVWGMSHVEAVVFIISVLKKWPMEIVRPADCQGPIDSGSVFMEWLWSLYFYKHSVW